MTEAAPDVFEAAKLGGPFTIYINSRFEIDAVRKCFLDGTGLALHIKAKVGPPRIDGNELVCDVSAVDDQVLQGEVKCALPNVDHYVLVGHFKEPEASPVTA